MSETTASDRSRLLSLQLVFALNALGFAVWFPRIPDVKQALDLDVMTLAFALFGMPAGTMLGFLTVGRLTARIGTKNATTLGGAAFFACFIGPGLATNAVWLMFSLFCCGLTIATIEVSMNAKASQTETALGRRIMTRCHGFWSIGTVVGSLIGGAFAQAEISFLTQQLIVQPLFILAHVLFSRRLLADDPAEEPEPEAPVKSRGFSLPPAALLLLCLVPIGSLLTEGAMMEWSALLLRENIGATPFATAATFAVFAVSMAITRLSGDRLAEMFGPQKVIYASAVLMAVGIFTFGLAPGLLVAVPAAFVVGLGCGNIYPLAMSMVGQMGGGRRREQNVATLALIAFTAFLIGPPLIGISAKFFGLPVALAMLAPIGLLPLVLVRRNVS